MPKYFCDYCDTYLTHDSPSVRKTHCAGRKHRENVKFYYEKWYEQNIQKLQPPAPQPQPHIPPPSSFGSLDFPPPPLATGLPTMPPPPMPSLVNVMRPPPTMGILPPNQLPVPNFMVPPPTAAGFIPPPPQGMLPHGMPPSMLPLSNLRRD